MFFDSVEKILSQLEQQPGWEKFRLHRQLIKSWNSTVSTKVAQNTRPLYINKRILWVATSSAARAQELSFQRYGLLKKLNRKLPDDLKDIRFSSSQWHQKTEENYSLKTTLFSLSDKQKSQTNVAQKEFSNQRNNQESKVTSAQDAKLAAQQWLKTIEQNSANFLTCPQCNAPTPAVEIKRWGSCYLCIAQKWNKDYFT